MKTLSLRMPDEFWGDLKAIADDEDRTITAQILRFARDGMQQYKADHERKPKDFLKRA